MKPLKETTTIGDALKSLMHPLIRLQQAYLPLWKDWENLVGPEIAANAWPHHVDINGVLHLAVSDSIWMQQLSFQRNTLLHLLNERLKNKKIQNIRLLLYDVKELRKIYEELRATSNTTACQPHGLSEDIKKRADLLVASIKDAELRTAVRSLYLIHECKK